MRIVNNLRLRNKMLIIYFLSVFIPVVLTNIMFYNITTNNVKKQKMNDTSLAIQQIRNDFLAQINAAVGISSVIYNDSLLNQYIEKTYNNQADYADNYHAYIIDMLEKYSPVYHAIQAITIYADNDTILYGGHVLPITDDVRQQAWFKHISVTVPRYPIIEKTRSDAPGYSGEVISVIRKIVYPGVPNGREKILKIDLYPELFNQIFRNATLEGSIYLINDNLVQYATEPGSERSRTVDFSAYTVPKGTIVLEEAFANIAYLDKWRIVGEFQEREVLAEVRKSKEFVLYLAMLNMVVPTILIIWFARSLSGRLARIIRYMKRVKNSSFEIIAGRDTDDEIGQLTAEFNRMTLQIKALINDVYMADIQKKMLELKRNQAQLHALQSQINPHFLFNALETIRMRSLIKQEHETAKIIHNMAKIFRKSLSWGKDLVSVKDELDLVVSFLEIQKYRFGDKLNYQIHVDESVMGAMIPKMTLQPLVENASIHGIEPLKDQGSIDISIGKSDEGLVCCVRDNGVGIPRDKLDALLGDLASNDDIGESVGIKNVYYRLKLFYGEAADFRIESEAGGGTAITIVVRTTEQAPEAG
jgi:two-component system sensor histidine kinase YesM